MRPVPSVCGRATRPADTGVRTERDGPCPRRRPQAPPFSPAPARGGSGSGSPGRRGRRPGTLRLLRPRGRGPCGSGARRVVSPQCPPPSSPSPPLAPPSPPPSGARRPGRADPPPRPSERAAAAAPRRRQRLPRAAPALPAAQPSRLSHFPSPLLPFRSSSFRPPPARGLFRKVFIFRFGSWRKKLPAPRQQNFSVAAPPAPALRCPAPRPLARPEER